MSPRRNQSKKFELMHQCLAEIKVEEMSHAIRLLRSFEGVDVIVTGELKAKFAQDTDARWLMKVEEHVRRVQLH